MTVKFFFINTAIKLPERKRLKQFIISFFTSKKKLQISTSIIFCDDCYLLNINRRFLLHDSYTDIITFNLSEKPQVIEGEIYISVDRIRENAAINRVSIKAELHRVIFHGLLHLCGFNDKSKDEKTIMTKMEDILIKEYFL